MPPIPQASNPLPRIITYYQTHHDSSGRLISLLPLLLQPDISLTHVILAAIHLNEDPNHITLNDHPPHDARFDSLWAELRVLQASGIKVMGMLGGAAQGSYKRLDGSDAQFERYYLPLRDVIRARGLDGLDLDVEEKMSLNGVIKLIDRLKIDFGKDFIITLAPVAAALLDRRSNLSGFDYMDLEAKRGSEISWYNAQFYCNWGDMSNPIMYETIIRKGWPIEKVVVGLVTNPANGSGFVIWELLSAVLTLLRGRHERFGGVMGWEYFNSLPGGNERPWEWAKQMTSVLRNEASLPSAQPPPINEATKPVLEVEADPDAPHDKPVQVPSQFDYYSDDQEQ
ncbi:glycoside hydrolase family 18 protein [Trichoderma chlorosporum]